MKIIRLAALFIISLNLIGCAEEAPSFSLLPDSDIFYQNNKTLSNKLDILWVIDNSGSMQEEQQNLADNFNAFITDFVNKGFDFQIAVTVTDAWRAPFVGNPELARFRDGTNQYGHTGVFVITPSTPNLISTFVTNVRQGINGNGDERAFQSFKTALNSNLNAGFLRSDAYLAVIIVSDEDDFSHNSSQYINRDYNYAGLHTVQSYVDYLDQKTQSTGALRRYSVSAITIADQNCLAQNASWGIIGQRYIDLAGETDGVVGDICSPNFSDDLDAIQNRIAELSTQFYLSRVPRPETIVVKVNDILIPEDPTQGWTYHADANSIMFHGAAIPPQGARISVDFDPVTIK